MTRPKTLSALKRYLKPGMRLMLVDHIHMDSRELPIPRDIIQVKSASVVMSAWPGHPPSAHSSFYWPKAKDTTIDDNGFTVNEDGIRMRYEYVDCPHGDPLCPCPDGDACHYVTLNDGSPAAACPKTGKVGCTECN